MRHRVFIAINLPENVKKQLLLLQKKWPELPTKWTKRDNIHITLVFLGYLSDEETVEVCKTVREVASGHSPFSINLDKICYGPPKKMPPRMVWAEGQMSEELGEIQADLERNLFNSDGSFGQKSRPYRPHITLGRIRQWDFRRIEPEEVPDIAEDISLNFSVDSIEVMESQLKRGGAEYAILESASLSK